MSPSLLVLLPCTQGHLSCPLGDQGWPSSARTPLGTFGGLLGSMVGHGLTPQLWSTLTLTMPHRFPLWFPQGRLQRALGKPCWFSLRWLWMSSKDTCLQLHLPVS